MRRRTLAFLGLLAASAAFPAGAELIDMAATLSGANEVPPVQSTGRGTAVVTLDTAESAAEIARAAAQWASGEPGGQVSRGRVNRPLSRPERGGSRRRPPLRRDGGHGSALNPGVARRSKRTSG